MLLMVNDFTNLEHSVQFSFDCRKPSFVTKHIVSDDETSNETASGCEKLTSNIEDTDNLDVNCLPKGTHLS